MGQELLGEERLLIALGHVITGEHKKRGWSQEKLADLADIPYGSLRKYIRGEEPIPLDRYARLARLFEMPLVDLMGLADDELKRMDRAGQ